MDLFKPPKLYFYRLLLFTLQPFYVRIFRLHGEGLENVPREGPLLFVANHSHLLDPFFIGAVLKRPVFQMASNEFFRKPLMRRFMWAMGAFPRKKGFVDFKSIKYAIQVVKRGHPLFIYPEGGRNWDGETLPVLKSTAKLVKLLKVPLVTVVSRGNYLVYPRWADKKRKSDIEIVFSKPVTFDKSTPDDVIIDHIQRGIDNNDNYTEREHISGKKPAGGLTRLLWRCPSCRLLEGLEEINGDTIACRGCGKTWEVNLHCHMREPGGTWRPIKEFADLMFRKDEIVPIETSRDTGETVYLQSKATTLYNEPRYPRLKKIGTGTLELTSRGLRFVIRKTGEIRFFKFEDIRGRSTERNTFFQIVLDDDIARFEMKSESCYKWETFYDYVRKKGGFREVGE